MLVISAQYSRVTASSPEVAMASSKSEFFYEYLNQRVVFYEQDYKQIFRHFATPPLPSQNTSRIKLGIRSGRNVQKYT